MNYLSLSLILIGSALDIGASPFQISSFNKEKAIHWTGGFPEGICSVEAAPNVDGVVLGALVAGLAGVLRPPDSGGGEFYRHSTVSWRLLQSHRVEGRRLHHWLQASGSGFLPGA